MARSFFIFLCVLSLIVQTGCATAPPSMPYSVERQRSSSAATVGVVAVRYAPTGEFRGPTSGKGEGAAKGAVIGTLGTFGALSGGSCSGPYCGAVVIIQAAIALAGGVAFGIAGAVEAESAATVEQVEATANQALDRLQMQEKLHAQVLQYAQSEALPGFSAINEYGPTQPNETPDYKMLVDHGIDNVLEIGIAQVGSEGAGINPPIALVLTSRARLIRTADGQVLDDRTYTFHSQVFKLTEWTANNSAAVQKELNRGYRTLAEQIVDEFFLSYVPPAPKQAPQQRTVLPEPAMPSAMQDSQREPPEPLWGNPPYYVLRPEYPEVHACLFCKGGKGIGGMEFAEVPQQFTLRWEAFPRQTEREVEKGRIENVTYELRLYNAHLINLGYKFDLWLPNEVIYERKGLTEPHHSPDLILEPCTRYYWTVRARFDLDGQLRATEWAGGFQVVGEPWALRHPSSLPDFLALFAAAPPAMKSVVFGNPAVYYYRFRTTCGTVSP